MLILNKEMVTVMDLNLAGEDLNLNLVAIDWLNLTSFIT